MRVLHLPKWYPHRYDDQDGDFVARHVAAIAAAPDAGAAATDEPLETAVVFAAVARGPLPRLLVEEVDLSSPVPAWRYYYRARPTGWGPLDRVLKLGLWLWAARRGLRAVRRHWGGRRPDLVHVHVLLRTGLLAWWLRAVRGIPYLVTEHWTLYLPANAGRIGRLRRGLTAAVVRRAAALHTVSANLRQALAALGATNAHAAVIPNVVDTKLFRLPDAATARHPRRLLHVAAFNERAKNLSGILRVVARLRAAGEAVQLRVAGYGPAEAALRALAAELGLLQDETVQFLGKLNSADVAAEMRAAAALVLFSNYENLPCVLVEAQASGLPAVATRVGGVPELLPPDGSRGLLVDAGDENGLQAALRAVLDAAPGRFDPALLRREAVARFGYAAVGGAFRRLYVQLLASSSS